MRLDFVRVLVADAAAAAQRLAAALRDDDSVRALGLRLGWDLNAPVAPLVAVAAKARAASSAFLELDEASNESEWGVLADLVNEVHAAIVSLGSEVYGTELLAAGFASEFPLQLLHWTAIQHIDANRPRLAGLLRSLGIVTTTARPAAGIRPAFDDTRVSLPDFDALLTSPTATLRSVWAWGMPNFDGRAFVDQVAEVLENADLPVGYVPVDPSPLEDPSPAEGALRSHLLGSSLVFCVNA